MLICLAGCGAYRPLPVSSVTFHDLWKLFDCILTTQMLAEEEEEGGGCGAGNWLWIVDVNAVSTDWWNCILVLGRIPTVEWTWGQAPGGWVTVWEKVEELWDEDRQMHGSQHAACILGSCQVLFMIFFSCPKGKNKSGRILWKIVRIVLFSLKSRSSLPKRKMMVYIFFHHYYYL